MQIQWKQKEIIDTLRCVNKHVKVRTLKLKLAKYVNKLIMIRKRERDKEGRKFIETSQNSLFLVNRIWWCWKIAYYNFFLVISESWSRLVTRELYIIWWNFNSIFNQVKNVKWYFKHQRSCFFVVLFGWNQNIYNTFLVFLLTIPHIDFLVLRAYI